MEDPELHAQTQLKLELEPQKDKTNKWEQTAFWEKKKKVHLRKEPARIWVLVRVGWVRQESDAFLCCQLK